MPQINHYEFPNGSVAYYISHRGFGHSTVEFGIVEENYTDSAVLHLYAFPNVRCVDGIPWDHYETPSEWRRIPKSGKLLGEILCDCLSQRTTIQYPPIFEENTALIQRIVTRTVPDTLSEDVLEAVRKGLLVSQETIRTAVPETETDSRGCYRITANWRNAPYKPEWITLSLNELFHTFREAQAEIDRQKQEAERLYNLSDYDFSVEDIDHTLNRWRTIYHIPDETVQETRQMLLSLPQVEDIVTRLYMGRFQWKYDRNRSWKDISEKV